jgi:hypothetical protein
MVTAIIGIAAQQYGGVGTQPNKRSTGKQRYGGLGKLETQEQ